MPMKIAVIGLGIIGSAWAKNLIADGHDVRCWNRTPKVFPNFYPSIVDAQSGTQAIFIIVADPAAVQSVLARIIPQLVPGQLVIQSSTISAYWTQLFAKQVEQTGALYVEAPFTGSKPAADNRQTVFYCGGNNELIEKARPFLTPLSSAILSIGPLGSASTLKLAMNLNVAGVAQTLCESLALARSAGISDDVYFSALSRNVSHSGLADLKEAKLRTDDFSPQFSVKHMAKDLRLALETAAGTNVQLEQTQQLRNIYDRGMDAGWDDDDFIGLMRLLKAPKGSK
jgi:3-hydroxyisobutyrate dehydrogenase-like beta-hydroxyacid dehydrogenase